MFNKRVAAMVLAGAMMASPVSAWEYRAEAGLEARYFTEGPGYAGYWHNGSIYGQAEIYHEWNDRDDQFTFTPYFRVDENDNERTHADIRELSWIHVADGWESRVGISKVFWGVTEAQHLVDIINQTDQVDQIDGEEKLGQPMINFSTVQDWGILDVFVLPGFRERTFASEDGRPGFPLEIDLDNAQYESGAEDTRVDFAVRWQHYIGDLNFALSHFSGTSRDPLLIPTGTPPNLVFTPFYNVIDQTGLELEYVYEGWIWKMETISRSGQGERYTALDAGFEYTQVGVFESDLDLGWLMEYLWEDRDPLLASPFEHDVLLGNRLTFNDVASTEILWGVVWDHETEEKIWSLESSRRIGDRMKVSLEGRFYQDTGSAPTATDVINALITGSVSDKPLGIFSEEDLIQLEWVYYF